MQVGPIVRECRGSDHFRREGRFFLAPLLPVGLTPDGKVTQIAEIVLCS